MLVLGLVMLVLMVVNIVYLVKAFEEEEWGFALLFLALAVWSGALSSNYLTQAVA